MTTDIREFAPDDEGAVREAVEIANAAAKVDAPWVHEETAPGYAAWLRHGWDGEPPRPFLARVDGVAVGLGDLTVFERDNLHLLWAGVTVHPDHRRRGVGTALWEHFVDLGRSMGRRTLATDAWEGEGRAAFAEAMGLARASQSINRRQFLADVDEAGLERMLEEARAKASDYELLRYVGPSPDDVVEGIVELTAAINDAPMDDLDVEDEVFTADRVRSYEAAQVGRGMRTYRLVARHRGTGELAGHTVVAVDATRPWIGEQHDTSVVRAHRGHRLGLLLKGEMIRWLQAEEPELATIDTWNAESNDHMVSVNEVLGYRVMGRSMQYQRSL